MMERLERINQNIRISVPPRHAGCNRKKCRLYELVKEKGMVETRMGELQTGIIREKDGGKREKQYAKLVQEGKRRESILQAIADISESGSCKGMSGNTRSNGNGRKAKEILKEHLLIEKTDVEGMIEASIKEKNSATSFDVILENYGYQREAERRLCGINRALEKLENGENISLEGLMPAYKIEHIERMIEQAYA